MMGDDADDDVPAPGDEASAPDDDDVARR